jgi:hypothetical protein
MTSRGGQAMISIQYFEPPPALRLHVSALYWFETAAPGFSDLMRAELGQIRLLVDGVARNNYKSGRQWEGSGAILQGPTTAPTHYSANTRLRLFGIGLLPLGWAELIGLSADELADNATDLGGVLPPALVTNLMDALASASTNAGRCKVSPISCRRGWRPTVTPPAGSPGWPMNGSPPAPIHRLMRWWQLRACRPVQSNGSQTGSMAHRPSCWRANIGR